MTMQVTDSPLGKAPIEVAGIPVIKVNENPLQRPGKDELLRELIMGGPEAGQDRRLMLTKKELAGLLEKANDSLTGRVQMDMVGIKIQLWRHHTGHIYETWTLRGQPKPEHCGITASLTGL